MNLAYWLTQAARRFPDEPAIIMGDRSMSWRELDRRVNALALALQARGIGRGDSVLVHSRNCHEIIETQIACFRLGSVWAPTNFRISPDEASWLAELSEARLLIISTEFEGHQSAITQSNNAVEYTVRIGPGTIGDVGYDEFIAEFDGQGCVNADVEHDDPCWYFFTSGTTGRSKAAVLTHGQMGFIITNHLCDLMPDTRQSTDASLVIAPLSHGSGIHYLTQLARGVRTVLPQQSGLDPEEVWELVEKYQITNMFTVPTIVNTLIDHASVRSRDRSSLRYVIYAGAPMYREDQKRALDVLGKVLVQYYGLGEVTGNISVLPPDLHSSDDTEARIGTCGIDRTGMQISIQDDDGTPLAANETGEICVCGVGVFAGYYNNPEENGKSFRNGWFRTGDLGHVDSEGFVFITGRASDMYISGGSNIYPREIEEKLLTHPKIREVAVVGMPDRQWGEIGVVAIVTVDGEKLDEQELTDWIKARVSGYKVPRRIHFFDELPKSSHGKITKKLVSSAIEEREAS
jgi:acyl-CoA synthetase (AMP-forming)/AMP-acid ligase II